MSSYFSRPLVGSFLQSAYATQSSTKLFNAPKGKRSEQINPEIVRLQQLESSGLSLRDLIKAIQDVETKMESIDPLQSLNLDSMEPVESGEQSLRESILEGFYKDKHSRIQRQEASESDFPEALLVEMSIWIPDLD